MSEKLKVVRKYLPDFVIDFQNGEFFWHFRCMESDRGYATIFECVVAFAARQSNAIDEYLEGSQPDDETDG